MAVIALIGFGMAVEAVRLSLLGQPAAAAPLAGGAIYFGHVLGLQVRFWGPRPRSRRTPALTAGPDGTKGVTFPYSAWPYYWLTAVLGMTGLLALAAALGAALSGTATGAVGAVVLGALVLVVGWLLVTMLRLAPGRVILSPTGVHHRSLTFTHFVPWHAVSAVSADWELTPMITVRTLSSPQARVHRYMRLIGSDEVDAQSDMIIHTAWLATDPSVVYRALSFYRSRPELQAELGTPEAVDRIGQGRAVEQ